MPLANSTRLLVTTAADWYIEYSGVLDPGALRHTSDDRQMAHNDNTNSVSFTPPFFFLFSLYGYHTKCKASDACYRWRKTVPVDGGMHLFSSRLARWRSFNVSSAQTNPHPTSPPSGSAATAKAQPTFSPKKRLYFIRRRGSDNTCARIPVLAMMHLGLKILSVNQRKETSPSHVVFFFSFLGDMRASTRSPAPLSNIYTEQCRWRGRTRVHLHTEVKVKTILL